MSDVVIAYLPSPPQLNVFRDWAGGYGTALASKRNYPGHDQQYFDIPLLQVLYIARGLKNKHITVGYKNLQEQEQFVLADFSKYLQDEQPRIFLTNLSLPSLDHDLQLLHTIKTRIPLKIVLIGQIARLFKDHILQERYADYIVMQDEELVTPDVIAVLLQSDTTPKGAFYLHNGTVVGEPSDRAMRDLDFVDFPAYECLDFSFYESSYPFNKLMRYMTVLTSKGCPYPCGYCPYPLGFGKKVIYRSPELVLNDIQKLINDFQVEFIVFRDQLLTLNRKHCEAILHGLIDRQINIVWLCETRYDLVDRELLQLMSQAGCREINYGLESGDETLFTSVAKAGVKKGLAYFGQIIQATKAAGIRCHTHLMLGLPDDSWKSIKTTVRFLKKYKPDSVQAAIFIPYPGTPLGEQLRQEGLVPNLNYQDYTGFKAVIPTNYMSIQDIEAAKAYIGTVWNRSLRQRIKDKITNLLTKRSRTALRS
jgi:anaerobic magnesium-protoporphyrin IX monomethyl ester cyclase